LLANPLMGDGYAIFSTEHVNLVGSGSGGVINGCNRGRPAPEIAQPARPEPQRISRHSAYVLLCGTAQGGQARVVNESQYDVDVSNKTSFYPNKVRACSHKWLSRLAFRATPGTSLQTRQITRFGGCFPGWRFSSIHGNEGRLEC
jgi:hypothetical protein